MKYKRYIVILTLLIIGLSVIACSPKKSTQALLEEIGATPEHISTADLTLPTVNGNKQISISQYKGSLVLLSLWISSCKYCNLEAPLLSELSKLTKNNKEIQIIGISRDASKEEARNFINIYNLKNYPQLYDPHGATHERVGYKIDGTPTTYIISPKGQVLGKITGYKKFNPKKKYKALKALYENTK